MVVKEYIKVNKKIIDFYLDEGYVVLFSDGSFNEITNRYGYGLLIITPNRNLYESYNSFNNKKYLVSRNVSGELMGVINGLEIILNSKYKKVVIFYDYEGIYNFANNKWVCRCNISKLYKDKIKYFSKYLDIIFIKVKSHFQNEYNDRVDYLAKYACAYGKDKKI